MRPFFDTNILIYAVDRDEPEKSATAGDLVKRHPVEGEGMISVQVLREFYSASRRLPRPLSDQQAQEMIWYFSRFKTLPESLDTVLGAARRSQDPSISFWDALIVESTISAGADRLFTEDLQDGQLIEGLRIEDPFSSGS